MNRVEFDPGDLTDAQARWWERWTGRAQRALDKLKAQHAAGEEVEFNSQIWGDLKEWLSENFFGERCAYCEGKAPGQAAARGEHWRPKGAVTERRDDRIARAQQDGNDHPGYWWLAYEWTNLLPSCETCNAVKSSEFPVLAERVFAPEEGETVEMLDGREQPLLLHPMRGEDPAEHLGFDEFGGIYPIEESELGKETIRVFGLDRSKLEEERFAALQSAIDIVDKYASKAMAVERPFEEVLGDRLEGAPFLSLVRAAVRRRREELQSFI